jgi:hypothetical protein
MEFNSGRQVTVTPRVELNAVTIPQTTPVAVPDGSPVIAFVGFELDVALAVTPSAV